MYWETKPQELRSSPLQFLEEARQLRQQQAMSRPIRIQQRQACGIEGARRSIGNDDLSFWIANNRVVAAHLARNSIAQSGNTVEARV